MTAQQIADYLSNENVAHNKNSQITRVYLKGGAMQRTYFLEENQSVEFTEQNKWVFLPINDLSIHFILDGEDIEKLEVERTGLAKFISFGKR